MRNPRGYCQRREWTSEWRDLWQEGLFLERSAGENKDNADIAMRMLKAVHRAKLEWDKINRADKRV